MRIISKSALIDFWLKQPLSQEPLTIWYQKVTIANWNSFNELKTDFTSADYVGDNRFVFNIGGNKYRLIAIVFFPSKKVYIRFVGTHAQYDKIKNIENI